jgi:hypothetical protein
MLCYPPLSPLASRPAAIPYLDPYYAPQPHSHAQPVASTYTA